MKFFSNISILIFIILISYSCDNNNTKDSNNFTNLISTVKNEFAPDKRVAIFNVSINKKDDKFILKGESDLPSAVNSLKEKLKSKGVNFIDSIVLLPDLSVGNKKYAVVNNSVANIRSKGKHSAELATQALLGTGLKVLKIQGDFYLVQTPDAYISWVDHGGVTLMDQKEYLAWNKAPKIIFTETFGYSYQSTHKKSIKVTDLVLGDQLKFISEEARFYKVEYPDKRIAYVTKEESSLYNDWIKSVNPSGELLEKYAMNLLGAPYLWGGTSAKGVDCSGFTKTAYLMNGLIIPRDASQQINAGENVDPNLNFENLQKGDLMFFGKKTTNSTRQKVTHVGIWLGNGKGEFIHASKQVRLSSIFPKEKNYDKANTERYLGSRRYLGKKDPLITDLKTDFVLTEIRQ